MSNVISYLFYSPSGVEKLEKLGAIVKYPKNQVLVKEGDYTEYCYIVKKGCVVSYDNSEDKKQRIFHFYEKNALFLEGNVLFEKPATLCFKTNCETELICISKRALTKAILEDPSFALNLIEAASDKMNVAMEQLRYEKLHDANMKICDMFLGFAEFYGVVTGNEIIVKKRLSHQMISELLGINRVTVSREIKKLKEMNLIYYADRFYHIPDIERLRGYTYE